VKKRLDIVDKSVILTYEMKITNDIKKEELIMTSEKRISDEKNPKYMFQTTDTSLLTQALDPRRFDIMEYVKKELASRGLNDKGAWVGFAEAKRIHGIS